MSNIQIHSLTLVKSWSFSSAPLGTGEAQVLTVVRMDGSSESFYLDETARTWLGQAFTAARGEAPSIN